MPRAPQDRAGAQEEPGEAALRLLDLMCGAGGCTKGFQRAGFFVVGVDARPQPNYCGDEFHQGDALDFLRGLFIMEELGFSAIAASPPCQAYANVTRWRGVQDEHPDLIGPTRELLIQTGLPYVLENVDGSPLTADFTLCGSQFGLPIRRHRYFETNWADPTRTWGSLPSCGHSPSDYSFDHGGKQPESVYRDAMGCEWMTVEESRQAIPPAYTEHIGLLLADHIKAEAKRERSQSPEPVFEEH